MLARICREAGARVRYNALLRDMNIEVLAEDLPCFGGAQLAVDITLRSVLGSSGEPQPHAAAVLSTARKDKEATYPRIGDIHALQARGRGDGDGPRKLSSLCGSWRRPRHKRLPGS